MSFRRALLAAPLLFALGVAAQQRPRVLVFYDMEGVSGINREPQTSFSHPDQYQPARKFLTGDVNAAIRGLVEGGAGDITVTDAHGSGNSLEPDILLDEMDQHANFEFRDVDFDPYSDVPDPKYQAIVCIGMHARANTPGFLAHTFTLEPAFRLNGIDITETEIIAHSAARFRVPVIMVSGDDVLQKQIAERFPLAEYGLVKRARGRADANLMPEPEAWSNIERAARRAIAKLPEFKPFPVEREYRFEHSFQNKAQTDRAAVYPGLTRVNETAVGYTTPDFISGYDQSKKLIQLATAERFTLLLNAVRARPDGKEIMADFEKLLITRWLEPEKMPKEDAAPLPVKKRYHGDN